MCGGVSVVSGAPVVGEIVSAALTLKMCPPVLYFPEVPEPMCHR